jgi:hypothetical protein
MNKTSGDMRISVWIAKQRLHLKEVLRRLFGRMKGNENRKMDKAI